MKKSDLQNLTSTIDFLGALNKASDTPFYVGCVIVSYDNSKVLLGCRREDGKWTGPGGGANPGESPKEAVIREIKEEAGIKVYSENLQELPSLVAKNKKPVHCFLLNLSQSEEFNTLSDPDQEVSAWGWYSVNQPLPEPMDENRKRTVLSGIYTAKQMNKAIAINEEMPGVDLNTAEFSMDDMASKDNGWVQYLEQGLSEFNYGDAPREFILDNNYKLQLSRVDDGMYSGSVKRDSESPMGAGDRSFHIEKMPIQSIVQAMKAKGYLNSQSGKPDVAEEVTEIVEEHEAVWEGQEGSIEEQAADAAAFEQIEEIVKPEIHEDKPSLESKMQGELAELLDVLQGRMNGDLHIHIHKSESLEKGRKAVPVGTISPNRRYIKTASGWEYYKPGKTSSKEKSEAKEPKEVPAPKPSNVSETARAEKQLSPEETEAEYVNARDSKVSNLGEDIKGSARHKRAEWKGLQSAESDGTAEKMVKRDTLLKVSPANFDIAEGNPGTILVLTEALKGFPKAPDYKYGKHFQESPEDTRRLYTEAYEEVKRVAESLQGIDDPFEAIKEMREKVKPIILEALSDRRAKRNSIAQSLVPFFNRTLEASKYGRPGSRAALGRANEFVNMAKQLNLEVNDKIEAIRKVVYEGKSFKDALGAPKGQKKLTAADMYVADAERAGGPELPTAQDQTDYLMNKAEMRGIQWGNSVTDAEREHHLKFVAESFKDLTDVLGLPEQMGSFNGRLGLAIGARGKGRAMAHYEPSKKVINLTRKNGVGSLAHEWGHFFDNILGEVSGATSAGREKPFLSDDAAINIAYGKKTDGSNPTMDAMGEFFGSNEFREFRSQVVEHVRNKDNNMAKGTEYWASTKEMWARCFETYITHKLSENGRKNTYLTGVIDTNLWPSPERMEKMAPYLDKIIESFKNSNLLKKALDFLN